MDHFLTVWTVIVYIESRLESGFAYRDLAGATGFSLPHLRAVFAARTGQTLARYILGRRVSRAAFELVHSGESALAIAQRYGFDNPDTFTRAFRRVTGLTPSAFRRQRRAVGRAKLCAGVYGVSEGTDRESERMGNMTRLDANAADGTVLYGVPRVGYGVYGCTPYPVCLKAALNYLGEHVDYDDVMVLTGAAFRLTWDTASWNGGNVDVLFAFDDPVRVYRSGVESLGREFAMLGRTTPVTQADPAKYAMFPGGADRQDFIDFIRERIDNGHPCIALGVIGPPEACLITGYRDGGKTLLGWNFFQDNPEFAAGVRFDESGYFVTDAWWDNPHTVAVLSVGPRVREKAPLKALVGNAVDVLSGRMRGGYALGTLAYGAWKRALMDEHEFPEGAILSHLAERLMCQDDATVCLQDGRGSAARYFDKLARAHPEQPLFARVARYFGDVAARAESMIELLGGCRDGEARMRALARPETREALCALIDGCKAADEAALTLLKQLLSEL